MIITRIAQFFHLAAVHGGGSIQRNLFTCKFPSPGDAACRGQHCRCYHRGRSEPGLRSGSWSGSSARPFPERGGAALEMLYPGSPRPAEKRRVLLPPPLPLSTQEVTPPRVALSLPPSTYSGTVNQKKDLPPSRPRPQRPVASQSPQTLFAGASPS